MAESGVARMMDELKALLALAEIDTEINGLKDITRARPKQLEPFRARAQAKGEKARLGKVELKRLKVEGDKAEQDIREKEEKISKCQIQINQAKTNDEYQVLLEQKRRLGEEVSQREEEGLEMLSKTEQLSEELKRLEKEQQECEEELKAAEKEQAEELAQIEKRLAELVAAREQAKRRVDPKYLVQYDRVLERLHDRAVVPAENGTCQGCFMAVTPQMVNTLILGKEIVTCKSCQRILYLPE